MIKFMQVDLAKSMHVHRRKSWAATSKIICRYTSRAPPRDSSAVREHSNHMSLHTARSENGMNNRGMNVDYVMKRIPWVKENNLGIGVVSLSEVTIFVSLLVPTAPLFVRFGLFSLAASSKARHGPVARFP